MRSSHRDHDKIKIRINNIVVVVGAVEKSVSLLNVCIQGKTRPQKTVVKILKL